MNEPTVDHEAISEPSLTISVITPCYNAKKTIADTIASVRYQGTTSIEHIVIDGGSDDGSVEIIREQDGHLATWISEEDDGMYAAIQKGFDLSTGQVMGWINADDMIHPKALSVVARIFNDLPSVEWLIGCSSTYAADGTLASVSPPPQWSRYRMLEGDYKWIPQEGVFWRRSLWERAGGKMATNLKLAGDLELWCRFFDHAQLYSAPIPIGGMRILPGRQLSSRFPQEYHLEAQQVLHAFQDRASSADRQTLRRIRNRKLIWKATRLTRLLNASAIYRQLVEPIYEIPRGITFDHSSGQFVIG
ncbi:MAG: glycosyltransferase [Planctomycetaceae bacterium]|nr:glycosyltransferase [Planctomycetaceae bacterium]